MSYGIGAGIHGTIFACPMPFSLSIHINALKEEGNSFTYKYDQKLRSISYTKGTFGWKRTYKYDYSKTARSELKEINKLDGVSCSVTSDIIKKDFTSSSGSKHREVTREVTITVSSRRSQAEFAPAAAFKNIVLSRHRDVVSRIVNDFLRVVKSPVLSIRVWSDRIEFNYEKYDHYTTNETFYFSRYGMERLNTIDEGVGLVLALNTLVPVDPSFISIRPYGNDEDGYTNELGCVTLNRRVPPPTPWN